MTRYLVLAHQTATSRELAGTVRDLARGDTQARFTLLVPAAKLSYWGTFEETKARAYAEEQAAAAKAMLESEGAGDVATVIGSYSPMDALADELRDGPGYDELVICTLPPGASRWLKRDLPHQAARRFEMPVTHVVAYQAVPAHA
ncbi:MAG: hypothetical protein WD557_15600 [Dehalococcoidia bacterium]